MNVNLKELKAHAYDLLANIEYLQEELRKTNVAIAQAAQAEKEQAEKEPEPAES